MPNIHSMAIRRLVRKLAPGIILLLTLSTRLGYSPLTDPSDHAEYPSFISPTALGDISLRMSDQYMPVIGVWGWGNENLSPEGFKKPIENAALHSPFNLLITFLRFPDKEIVNPNVHDQVKLAAEYAIAHGLMLVADIDVRSARRAFQRRYPDELQQMLRLKEVRLSATEPVEVSIPSLDLNDHYSSGSIPHHMSLSGSLVRVISYRTGAEGIEESSLADIAKECTLVGASKDVVTVRLPAVDSTENHNTHASIWFPGTIPKDKIS